jgi:hypothetical protein
MQLGGQDVDGPCQLGVGLELQLLFDEVMVVLGPLQGACLFCPIITNVERKIASSETTNVSVGHGPPSATNIQTANTAACRYTNVIDPANAVIASATRSWTSALRAE